MAGVETAPTVARGSLLQEYLAREQRLLDDLESLAAMLSLFGEERWARHFAARRRELAAAVATGAGRDRKAAVCEAIRGAYQGSLSINDVVIHPLNGHRITAGDVTRVNNRLNALRNGVYALSWLYEERRFRTVGGG